MDASWPNGCADEMACFLNSWHTVTAGRMLGALWKAEKTGVGNLGAAEKDHGDNHFLFLCRHLQLPHGTGQPTEQGRKSVA